MRRADLEILGKVLLQFHPTVSVTHFAAPGTDPQHTFQIMQACDQSPSQGMNESPDQEDQDGFHRTVAPFGRMSRSTDQEGRKIDNLINPAKKEDKTEPEAFVPKDLGPTLLNLHNKLQWTAHGSRAPYTLHG